MFDVIFCNIFVHFAAKLYILYMKCKSKRNTKQKYVSLIVSPLNEGKVF